MRNFIEEHSLSLALSAIMAISLVAINKTGSGSDPRNFFIEVFGATLGAWLVVVFTKWFQERGKKPSKESK